MAVIEKRKTKDGKIQYRVKIRLKGYPPQGDCMINHLTPKSFNL